MKLIDPHDWKRKLERLEDKGNAPDMADFIAEVQENAIKSTLEKAKKKVKEALNYNG